MSMQGTWKIWHRWKNVHYSFFAEFSEDGSITVEGGYTGTWTRLGTSSQISLAIYSCGGRPSITCYNGNILGLAMGGEMTGDGPSGVQRGEWVAHHMILMDAEESPLRAPGE